MQTKLTHSLFLSIFFLLLIKTQFTYASNQLTYSDFSIFTDISKQAGVAFLHFNGMTGKFYFPEMTGMGGGLVDYDNDGDLDLYLIQGNLLGSRDTMEDALFPVKQKLVDRLYRNNLLSPNKEVASPDKLTFTDVTEESSLNIDDYGMGIATGDYNNDGWVDILVTNYGKNRLLKNNGDGTFSDDSHALDINDESWSTSASFFDYDKDGFLDLYIANYVYFDVNNIKKCYAPSSREDYCGPSAFVPQKDILYHNQGDGTFKAVTLSLLKNYIAGPGLGVIAADFNGDGWVDIYVANDGAANQLWLNKNGKYFEDDALFSGTSVNSNGKAEASMGVDAADFDNDGDLDLFMTHLMGETNTLYQNDGSGLFSDITQEMGLGLASLPYTAFGTGWIDYDNDSYMDLIVLNGAVLTIESQLLKGEKYPLKQPNLLFQNHNGKKFRRIEGSSVSALMPAHVSRGVAIGDIDNDGDSDVVIFNNNGPTRILQNTVSNNNNWIGFRLLDKEKIRDSFGAKVEIVFKDGSSVWRRTHSDGSYCSANDPRVLIGFAQTKRIQQIKIHWPDGQIEKISSYQLKKYNTVCQGCNKPI